MGDCFTAATAVNFAAKDTNRLMNQAITKTVIRKSPYLDVLEGGKLGNESDVVRTVVQGRAYMGTSLVKPEFDDDVNMCSVAGNKDQVGSFEYQIKLGSYRGRGPEICVNKGRTRFAGSYAAAEVALKDGIVAIQNSDIRYNLLYNSGLKAVAKSGVSFDNQISGGEQLTGVKFGTNLGPIGAARLPNTSPTFKFVRDVVALMQTDFLLDGYSENGIRAKFIGSDAIIEKFRDEQGVKDELLALTKGAYKVGKESIDSFAWIVSTGFRGIGMAVDAQPLRATGYDANGDLVFVEPEIPTAGANGVVATRNPDWVSAPYEVAFVILPLSFRRLVPQGWNTSEGSVKFNPKTYMAELVWHYVIDNDCNQNGDIGWHRYQISRAYEPVRPHAVCPIVYKRCDVDYGMSACNFTTGTGTGV